MKCESKRILSSSGIAEFVSLQPFIILQYSIFAKFWNFSIILSYTFHSQSMKAEVLRSARLASVFLNETFVFIYYHESYLDAT